MQFGVQFFPDVRPEEKSARDYFRDALDIAERADALGYTHVRIVEHYFHYYGGYTPNPIVFLSAASQRTTKVRLVTGALLPVFNHPLKLAGEIGMLDAISGGRLDVGFARAFLPHEFRRFGISPNESIARFREGIEQVDLLLREENVTHRGRFHAIVDTTSLPRPTQRPRPKFYVAALSTPDSFEYAGRMGFSIMAIPMAAERMRECLQIYRRAYRENGHPGSGEVMLAFHMFCDPDGDRARAVARKPLDDYLHSLVEAACDWTEGLSSEDYPGYDKVIGKLKGESMETQIASGAAWIGSPEEIMRTIARLQEQYGGFEHASLQINFNLLPQAEALRSLERFARDVLPQASGLASPHSETLHRTAFQVGENAFG